jgi:hypothetical protein
MEFVVHEKYAVLRAEYAAALERRMMRHGQLDRQHHWAASLAALRKLCS